LNASFAGCLDRMPWYNEEGMTCDKAEKYAFDAVPSNPLNCEESRGRMPFLGMVGIAERIRSPSAEREISDLLFPSAFTRLPMLWIFARMISAINWYPSGWDASKTWRLLTSAIPFPWQGWTLHDGAPWGRQITTSIPSSAASRSAPDVIVHSPWTRICLILLHAYSRTWSSCVMTKRFSFFRREPPYPESRYLSTSP